MRGRSFLQGPAAAPVWKILLCLLPLGIQEPDPQRADRAVYRARHILIPWKESAGAGATTTRTKAEAKKLADELHARIRAGESFAELAMKHSSDPSRLDGGDLGQFRPKEIYGFFVEWIKKARPGALLPLKESRFGYHIVERLAVQNPWPDLVAASHIMIAHSGARGAPKSVRRSREEARLIAGRVLALIKTGKLSFEQAASTYSDDSSTKKNGGSLGTRPPVTCISIKCADRICALEVGQIAGPVESPAGFHILRRDRVNHPFRAAQILVAWKGAKNAPDRVSRSKADALVLARKLLEKLRAGESFAALAREHSDGFSASRGGDLGLFYKGDMVAAFEQAVEKTEVGKIAGPIETEHGYHIILRTQ